MRKILFFILSIVCATTLLGQTPSSADKLFKAGNYAKALEQYHALTKSYPTNQLFLYRYARCAQELGDDATAIQYFEKSGNRYTLKHFYAAESHLRLWQTEQAINEYQAYLKKEPNERTQYIQQQITAAEKLQRYLNRVERLQIIDSINVSIDSMLHVIALSAEAGTLTLTDKQLVYTNQRNDRCYWSTTQQNNTLLVSKHRLLDRWSTPDTLPSIINFTPHQCAPFLLSDGVTMYFAAQDTNGLGGLDIYVSRYNTTTETYTTPENIGFPYNSTANEYLLVLDETRQIGYLATDRFAKQGHVHVYSFAISADKQYWRNIAHDTLVQYAQLSLFEHIDIDTINSTVCQQTTDELGDFYFVINDSIIYHSIEDFQISAAREKYNEWMQTEQLYLSEQQLLHRLREEYTTADDNRKRELTPTILRLENRQNQLQIQCEQLLHSIRKIEIEYHQQ